MMLTLCLALLFAFQDEEAINEKPLEAFPIADRFSEALQKYNSVERSESEPMFEEIIGELREKLELTDDDKTIMVESLKFMGALNYPDRTESYFRDLIRFDPSHELDSNDLPPKIIEVFDELKQELVGRIRIKVYDIADGSSLEDAVFVVNNRTVGSVYGEEVFSVFAGEREIAVQCPNYDTFVATQEVIAGQEAVIDAPLTRIASQVFVVTQPAGCEVLINDKLVGATDSEAPRHYRQQVASKGFSLSDVGGLVLNDLAPGTYILKLRKPCYRERMFEVEIDEPRRINFNPVFMDSAEAFLSVSAATDSTALVYLDKDRIDYLPIENHRVCPGEYELRVSFQDSEYIKKITLEDGESKSFLAEPLPSIAWFGLEDDREGKPPGDMDAQVNSLKRWNVRQFDPYDTTRVPVNPFSVLFDHEEITPDISVDLTKHVKADLYMAARVVRKKVVIRTVEVVFWTPLTKKVQVASFDFREFQRFAELLKQMDAMPGLTKPWLGIQVARLHGMTGVKILEVDAGGPLAGQANPGEMITSVNGNLILGPHEIMGISSTEALSIEVGGRLVETKPLATIAEVPFSMDQAPQAMLARFEKMARYHPDPLIRKSALFNQARFQLFLGNFKSAFDIFSSMTIDTSYGINQGTLNFYQGLCFRQLGLSGEATSAFQGVLSYPGATLFDAYGPKAAYWAEAEINNPNQ